MSLINRYVAAVGRHLPPGPREDIARELSSSLTDELDELETALGRPLDDSQIADVLKRRGHPLLVAATYHGDRSLISPQTFPLYLRVLKSGLLLVGSIVLASKLFGGGGIGGPGAWWGLLHDFYWASLWVFAWATLAFFLLDSWITRGKIFSRWDPTRLRPVPAHYLPIGSSTAIMETIFGVLVLGFLSGGLTIGGRWINADNAVTIMVIDSMGLIWAAKAALLVVISIALSGFLGMHWSRLKLVAYGIAHLLITVALGAVGLSPGGLGAMGAEIPAEHASSLVNSTRGFLLFGALLSLLAVSSAVKRLRRLQ